MKLGLYLQQFHLFSPGIADDFIKLFKTAHHRKGHLLLEEGNLSKRVFFIEDGLARTWYANQEKNITHHFFAENSFFMAIEPIFYNQPSPYYFEMLEDSTILSAPFEEIEAYADRVPRMEKIMRMLLIDVIKTFSDRLHSIQFQTARERYESLLKTYPDILLRAPLGHIASYLGITQQTLSVIRSQK